MSILESSLIAHPVSMAKAWANYWIYVARLGATIEWAVIDQMFFSSPMGDLARQFWRMSDAIGAPQRSFVTAHVSGIEPTPVIGSPNETGGVLCKCCDSCSLPGRCALLLPTGRPLRMIWRGQFDLALVWPISGHATFQALLGVERTSAGQP